MINDAAVVVVVVVVVVVAAATGFADIQLFQKFFSISKSNFFLQSWFCRQNAFFFCRSSSSNIINNNDSSRGKSFAGKEINS